MSETERKPQVRDGVIDEHVYCAACGYDLYGSHAGRCPECGAVGAYRWPAVYRPLPPGWSRAAIGLAVTGLGLWLVFYTVQWACGLRLTDLRDIMESLVLVECVLTYVTIAYSIAIGAAAVVERDRKSTLLFAVAVVLAVISGCVMRHMPLADF